VGYKLETFVLEDRETIPVVRVGLANNGEGSMKTLTLVVVP
jgi:hypothetical protein